MSWYCSISDGTFHEGCVTARYSEYATCARESGVVGATSFASLELL